MLSDQRRCQTEQNSAQFWRLPGAVLGEAAIHDLPYDARLVCVLSHGIGIWDVLDACHRQGSLDSAIRNAKSKDFDSLWEHAPLLKRVWFNGKTAGRFAGVIGQAGYETLVLPSSSPANAMLLFEQTRARLRGIRA
ncbi:DNA-deoxyinosine glycosylase [Burkholderia cepacia]|uniref:DNA-deoxyinosine glycosylase n=1 Tax=Burkholderia cepacia TaxID=292 RepID=UPI00249F423F|nr:DNA-deoxyinosine glycosylase [Burkholderia cepacia]WGY67636.1 DNA-deoxyinosine glycosylase [Burkholderia cepacia]